MTATGATVLPPPGREAEAAVVLDRIAAVVAGSGGAVLLSGEGGVGKTTLSAWASEEARARGVLVLDAPCFALSTETPYACLVSAFGPVLRGERDVAPSEVADGLTSLGLLFDAVPVDASLTRHQSSADAPLARSRLHGALATLTSRLTTRTPVMLVVDDLHWADVASLEVLHVLTSDLPHLALLVLATLRPFEADARVETRRLLRALRRAGWTTTVDVGGLDREATRSLLQQRLGSVVPARLVELVHRRSAGTPLVAEELIELMVETGALRPVGRRWELTTDDEVPVPAVADDLIGDRLERLGPASIRLVATVAVAAEPATTDLVSQVTGVAASALARDLDALRRAGLLDRAEVAGETAWVAHHPIIGEVAVSLIGSDEGAAIHRAFADQLAGAGVERRGRHLVGAGVATLDDGDLAVLVAAGRAALERGAPSEACRVLAVALDGAEQGRGARHVLRDVLWLLGLAWTRRGEYRVAAHHLDRALDLARHDGDPTVEAALLIDAQEARWGGPGVDPDLDPACDALSHRLEDLGAWADAHRLRRGQLVTRIRAGEAAAVGGLFDELARIEGHVDDREAVLWGQHLRLLPDLQALRHGRSLLAAIDDRRTEVEAYPPLHRRILHERLDLLVAFGTRAQILEAMRDERDLGERLGDRPTWRLGLASWHVAVGDGDFDRTAEIAEVLGVIESKRPAGYLLVAGALVHLATGRAAPVVPRLRPDGRDAVLDHLVAIAELLLDRDARPEPAEAVIGWWRRRRFVAGMPLVSAIAAGIGHVRLGEPDGCREVAGVLRAFDGGGGQASAWASVLDGEAALDVAGRALAYRDAAERFDALGRPFDAGVCRLTAVESGAEVDRARLDEAATRFEAAGATWLSARLADHGGGRPGPPPPTVPRLDDLGLTAREREVADVVAEGLSNREVANRLYISVRTVTSHLDHIYTKLGIGSRRELADLLAGRAGPDDTTADVTRPDA